MKNKEIERIKYLTEYLNKCADEYYNTDSPSLSDAQYDALFDELSELEKMTGTVLATSPTKRVGYAVMSNLEKVTHTTPLLSLAKTKDASDIKKMLNKGKGCLTLKIDGLTVKLVYTGGLLTQASTRGDGNEGEIITHNAKVFANIPLSLPENIDLTVTGEAYIDIASFNKINDTIDNDEEKFSTPRNLAAGSVRQLDSQICAKRGVRFMPFNVLEGLETVPLKSERLRKLAEYGFDLIPIIELDTVTDLDFIKQSISNLKNIAFEKELPIDGIVFSYDDIKFGASLGKTSHHYRDGIAYKFGDPHFNTVLKNIEWNISRTGQLTPIAVFEPVEIDNTIVERASLHNITFIENLKLLEGDEIKVSKRNMIIPHVEENLSNINRDNYICSFPTFCPICKQPTAVDKTSNSDRQVKVLYCKNKNCAGKQIKKFTHFVSKQAINIDGLSEQALTKFINQGWLSCLADIFELEKHYNDIAATEGFGKKSATNLIQAIKAARNTTFTNFIVSLNIDLMGKNSAGLLEKHFKGDIDSFKKAAIGDFDFTQIDGFGEIMNRALHEWFSNSNNVKEFDDIEKYLNFKKVESSVDTESEFYSKTVVITGSFENYTRDELTEKFTKLGAKVTTSVSKKTDFVICGENAGSKLIKAEQLGIPVITADKLSF